MKKGIAPAIAVLGIALVMIGLVFAFIAGSIWGKQHAEKKYLSEARLISKSDEVETYVRSFMRATDLSSVQGLDAFGTGQIILPYESKSQYHQTYNIPYWQIYKTKLIPPKEVLLNKARQKTAWVASCYLENYMDDYESFSQEVTMDGSPILTVDSIGNDEIIVKLSGDVGDLSASLSGDFGWGGEKSEINIKRDFRPYSRIDTNFKKVIEAAESIVYSDLLGIFIRNDIYPRDMSKLGEVRTKLDNLADGLLLAKPGIKIILNISKDTDYEYDEGTGTAAAIINVTIYDESADYSFYDFPTEGVKIRYLGVNFLAKVGDQGSVAAGAIGDADEVDAQTLTIECPSGLGIMSPKDICNFFTVSPEAGTCIDPDPEGWATNRVCKDFTGFYTDLCDGQTLYEYDCDASSEICYPINHPCPETCEDGGCATTLPTTTTPTTTTTTTTSTTTTTTTTTTIPPTGVCGAYSYETPANAVASSEFSSTYTALKAIDGIGICTAENPSCWFSQSDLPPHWIYFDLENTKCISGIKTMIYYADVPLTTDIQVSDDASAWKKVVTGWTVSTGDTWVETSFAETTGRYIRLYETSFARSFGTCTEFQAYTAEIVVTTTTTLPGLCAPVGGNCMPSATCFSSGGTCDYSIPGCNTGGLCCCV